MKKKNKIIFMIFLIIGIILLGMWYQHNLKKARLAQTQLLFEDEIISRMEHKMRRIYKDLEVEVLYEIHPYHDTVQIANLVFHSNKIEDFYTTEWHDKKSSSLFFDLQEIRRTCEFYAGNYIYDVDGNEMEVILSKPSGLNAVIVYGERNKYRLSIINKKSISININGNIVYYSGGTKTKTKKEFSTNKSAYSGGGKYDPYDVHEYDDPDDFAEEWAEEFGDGDYDDGYDDAYDYWEDEYEE